MAVDERKANLERPMGTVQDVLHNCGPCEREEEHNIANVYCADCREYLCSDCRKHHGRNKASKHHTLLSHEEISSADVSQLPTATSTEMCTLHKQECINFFCPKHKTLGCSDCIILNHRTCDIEYIPDKSKRISDSSEYKTTVSALAKELTELNSQVTKINVKHDVAASTHDQCLRDITTFQVQINQRIDELRKQVQRHAELQMSKTNEEIQKDKKAVHEMKSKLDQACFDMNRYKTTNQESQLFICMKKAQSILKEKEGNTDQICDTIFYKFEASHRLESLLTELDIFGKLTPQSQESSEILEPLANGIVVLKVPEDVTQDSVSTYFENTKQSQGGETVKIDVHEDEKYCLVFFKDQSVAARVCEKRDHVISSNPVEVHSLHEFLGMQYSFPLDDQDPFVMKYFKRHKSKRAQLESEFSKCRAKILWDVHPILIQLMYENESECRCKSLRHWKEKSNQVLKRFTDAISITNVAFTEDVWEDVLDALNSIVVNDPDNIAVSPVAVSYEVHIICDKGHAEKDLYIILETLRPFCAKTKV